MFRPVLAIFRLSYFLYLFLFCVVFIIFLFLSLFLLIRPVRRDPYTTCACMLIVRS